MLLLAQALPLLAVLALLVSGRATPVGASFAGLLLAAPAALLSGPHGPGFLAEEGLRGAWLALQPITMVAGGLLFHAALGRSEAAAAAPDARRVFVATFLAGAFAEGAMGFSVGAVFALAALRAMGLGGPPAGALALFSLTLVPWGALGPGTALGAALTGQDVHALSLAAAWMVAPWLLALLPLAWRLSEAAGVDVPGRERAAQFGLLLVVCVLLIASHRFLPFEVAGLVATGPPLLYALWRLDPPRERAAWRAAARRLAPWLLLLAAILAARGWTAAPVFRPWADLPGFGPGHVAVALWVVALALLFARPGGAAAGAAALRRAARPALAMLCYVVLARWMAGSGAAASLADAAAAALGGAAPFAIAPLGLAAGIATGSNVAANAALVAVQDGLGRAAGLAGWVAPAVHNFAGAAGAGMSFSTTALVCALLADGTRPAQIWRLLVPSMLAVVLIGAVAVRWPHGG